MSDGVRIRPLEASDIPELLALARDTWHAHYPSIITLAQIEYMLNQRYQPELISADLDRSSRYWDVLERLGRLMAFAQYEPVAPGECKLDKLYVRHDARHQGFGSRLLAHVEREALVAAALRGDRGRGLGLRREVDADHLGPVGGEPLRHRPADAGRGAADHGDTSREIRPRAHGLSSRGFGFRCA